MTILIPLWLVYGVGGYLLFSLIWSFVCLRLDVYFGIALLPWMPFMLVYQIIRYFLNRIFE